MKYVGKFLSCPVVVPRESISNPVLFSKEILAVAFGAVVEPLQYIVRGGTDKIFN